MANRCGWFTDQSRSSFKNFRLTIVHSKTDDFRCWCLFKHTKLKGLILAQNERWRRGLGMQVVREETLACFGFGQWRKGE